MSESKTIFTQKLEKGLAILEISLSGEAVERLFVYFTELRKWSRKVNLIAKGATYEEIVENHFIDSLTLLPLLEGGDVHLLDVGSGAGFPGLVLKAARPEMRLTLVEPRLKRISFLKHVARTLKLEGVEALACRVEDERLLPSDQDFTHVTSRAVSEVGPFLEMVSRFSNPGLQVICMKGPKWQQELERAETIVRENGYVQSKTLSCRLPFSGAERNMLVFLTNTRL
ncbi:16S rRNA (guanine(527)-N(7))-methyltransferase RsmG [Desulfosediminicola ganghwensis]|uniref:16S rRNA (guanine(527)-N(7))-methyltransferase RsmG n=1 Tax=Desulfosediminicola ganghwensis TaxID=2569540 RepID=UPI0010AD6CFD|nr:16S rRNA (guanine(527)-N(7))-methyltransferase RsmG [Desulfosediminicola ganghwensis]